MKPFFVVLSYALIFSACSSTSTDNSTAISKNDFEQKVTSQSNNVLSVSDFQKTNGFDKEVFGQKFYILQWTAHVKVQSHVWRYGDMVEGFWNSFKVSDEAPGNSNMTNGFAIPKEYQAGDELEFQGEYGLQKTENGWQVADYSLKSWRKM